MDYSAEFDNIKVNIKGGDMDIDNSLESRPKRRTWLWIILALIILVGILVLLRGDEDTWIKDKYGNWIKHGNPSTEAPTTSTSSELKFDQSASSSDTSYDPNGPFYHKVYKDESLDGLTFTENGEMIIDKASVPDVVKFNDNKLYVYAVDGANRSNSGVMVAVSSDEGASWKQGSVQIKSEDEGQSAADPQAILQDDGSIRLFYMVATGLPDKKNGQPVDTSQGTFMIKSALSEDGVNFVEENGIRYQSVNEQITDPDVIKINNKWYMYLSKGSQLIATVSNDGNTFTFLQNIRKSGSVSKTVPIDNNQFRQYFCRDGISSATSSDGLSWIDDPGVRIKQDSSQETICDPSPVKIDSKWLMIYKVQQLQK